jgi:hypothetical protein
MLSFRLFVLILSSSALASQRRYKTSGTSTTFITMKKNQPSFRKSWLSDPATYPLLFVLGSAMCLVGGVVISCIANSPDVKLTNERKHTIIRTWGLRD